MPPSPSALLVVPTSDEARHLEEVLRAADLTCHTALTLDGAFTLLRLARFDLVVLELVLLGVEELPAAALLAALREHAGRVPILGLAPERLATERPAVVAPLAGLVVRPFHREVLLTAVRRLVGAAPEPTPSVLALALSVAAHEVRGPLTVIQAAATVALRLAERDARSTEVGLLTSVLHQSERLRTLIEELLDVARLQSEQFQLRLALVEVVELVRTVVAQMALTTERHTLRVLAISPRVVILADRARLEQVLVNLLQNAITYSEGGEVLVSVAEEGDGVQITVEDHGRGLTPAEQEHVFEAFYRPAGAGPAAGLGLGLYIVREIVQRHGGRVWVRSAPGLGSRFHVWLPRRPPGSQPPS